MGVGWVRLAQDGAQWWAVMNTAMKSPGFIKIEGVLNQVSDYRLLKKKKNSTHGISWLCESVSQMNIAST
jgi:hypothetical protein